MCTGSVLLVGCVMIRKMRPMEVSAVIVVLAFMLQSWELVEGLVVSLNVCWVALMITKEVE